MSIILQRIYDDTSHTGYRVLIDRLWPRGIRKSEAGLDEWCKDLAPSAELRKWFDHDPQKWESFRQKYHTELSHNAEEARSLLHRAGHKNLVLLYAAKDQDHCNAVVLKDYLSEISSQ